MPSEKATDQSEILDLGSQNSLLYNMQCAHNFFQKSLHPSAQYTLNFDSYRNSFGSRPWNSIRLSTRSGSCNLDPKHDLFLCCSLEKKFSTVCTVESLKQYCFNVKNARSLIFVHANQEIFYQIHFCLTGYENKPGNNPIVFGWIYLSGNNSVIFWLNSPVWE